MEQLRLLEDRVSQLESAFKDLEKKVDDNTEVTNKVKDATAEVKADTSQLVEWMRAGEGFFKVMGWIGKGVKWVGGVAVGAASVLGVIELLRKMKF